MPSGMMGGYSSLFRSRWKALLWAAGICFTAIQVAGFKQDHGDDASGDQITAQQQADAQAALNALGAN